MCINIINGVRLILLIFGTAFIYRFRERTYISSVSVGSLLYLLRMFVSPAGMGLNMFLNVPGIHTFDFVPIGDR